MNENDFTYDIAATWLNCTKRINLIPVVDKDMNVLYALQKVNKSWEIFFENEKSIYTQYGITETVERIRNEYPRYKIWLATDEHNLMYENKLTSSNDINQLNDKSDIVIIAFNYDYNAIEYVKQLTVNKIKYSICIHNDKKCNGCFPVTEYYKQDRILHQVFIEESYHNGYYFDFCDFQVLCQWINKTRDVQGVYVEIG